MPTFVKSTYEESKVDLYWVKKICKLGQRYFLGTQDDRGQSSNNHLNAKTVLIGGKKCRLHYYFGKMTAFNFLSFIYMYVVYVSHILNVCVSDIIINITSPKQILRILHVCSRLLYAVLE